MAEADELRTTIDAIMAIIGAIATKLKIEPAEIITLVEHATRNLPEPRRSAVRARVQVLENAYKAAL